MQMDLFRSQRNKIESMSIISERTAKRWRVLLHFLCFFFSSRRRHTRYWRDWSSDVCSSDLAFIGSVGRTSADKGGHALLKRGLDWQAIRQTQLRNGRQPGKAEGSSTPSVLVRSEERRVGKEGRSRWSPYH